MATACATYQATHSSEVLGPQSSPALKYCIRRWEIASYYILAFAHSINFDMQGNRERLFPKELFADSIHLVEREYAREALSVPASGKAQVGPSASTSRARRQTFMDYGIKNRLSSAEMSFKTRLRRTTKETLNSPRSSGAEEQRSSRNKRWLSGTIHMEPVVPS